MPDLKHHKLIIASRETDQVRTHGAKRRSIINSSLRYAAKVSQCAHTQKKYETNNEIKINFDPISVKNANAQ